MGLGLIGALGGLGESGVNVGKQMYADALDKEKQEYLLQRQQAMLEAQEALKERFEDNKRKKIADVIKSAASDPVDAEGPPTEGGQTPKRPMNEREKTLAIRDRLYENGMTDSGVLFDSRLHRIDENERNTKRDEINDRRYEKQYESNERRADLADKREERMAKMQQQSISQQAAANSRAERLLNLQLSDHDKKEKAEGLVAGYKVAKGRGLLDAADIYRENALGLGVDPEAAKKGSTKIMKDDMGQDIAVHEDATGNLTQVDPRDLPRYGAKQTSGKTGFDSSTGEVWKDGKIIGKAKDKDGAIKLLRGI